MEPSRDLPPGLREQLDLPHAGLVTFGHRPFLTEPEQLDSWQPDVAIVGAPFDISTTNRPGARFGPRAIRSQAYEPGTYHLDLGIEIFDWLEVVDYGDAYCPHGQTEVGHHNIRAQVGEVASRGIIPVILGGDHSITWPAATAVASHHGFGNVGIVHFDAHADTADIIEGNLASHGTPMRRLIESGAVLGRNFVQVGPAGLLAAAGRLPVDAGPGHALAPHARGVGAGHRRGHRGRRGRGARRRRPPLRERRHRRARPRLRPGTGTPEPGGMTPADLLRTVRALAMRTNLVALDVVEVAPPYDVSDTTVNNAHRVVFEALAGLAWQRREAAGGTGGPPAMPH